MSWKANIASDPFLGPGLGPLLRVPKFLLRLMSAPASGRQVNDPLLSPLLGSLENLPPTLIQVSRDEMLYSDAQRYANKADEAGSPCELQVWPKMVHVFQGFPELPETKVAYQNMANFIAQHRMADQAIAHLAAG